MEGKATIIRSFTRSNRRKQKWNVNFLPTLRILKQINLRNFRSLFLIFVPWPRKSFALNLKRRWKLKYHEIQWMKLSLKVTVRPLIETSWNECEESWGELNVEWSFIHDTKASNWWWWMRVKSITRSRNWMSGVLHDWYKTRKSWKITFLRWENQVPSTHIPSKDKTFDEESVSFLKSYWWFTSQRHHPWNIINYSPNNNARRYLPSAKRKVKFT